MTNLDNTVQLHKALAHPARLRALAMLRGGELCACQIIAVLDLAASTVSAHMAELRRAGLITERKDGRWVSFALAKDPAAKKVLSSIWKSVETDSTVAADAKLCDKLRSIGPETLCSAELSLTELGIKRK